MTTVKITPPIKASGTGVPPVIFRRGMGVPPMFSVSLAVSVSLSPHVLLPEA